MLIGYKRGQTSIVLRVKILNSSVTTGAGLTGLTNASAGLIISTIADNEATATAYTVAGSNVETITTLGTFAAPTSGKCRFKEVDATNHPGVYEIQIADARFAVSSARSLLVSISGASNAAQTDVCIPLRDLDPYDPMRAGLTALANANAGTAGGGPVLDDSGNNNVNVTKWDDSAVAATNVNGVPVVDLGYTAGDVYTSVTSSLTSAGTTTLCNDTNRTEATNSLRGRTVRWLSGDNIGLCSVIASNVASTSFTVADALPNATADTDQYELLDTACSLVAASGLSAILIEAGISASASLTNDTGTQLTSINLTQAVALILSAAAAKLQGADGSTVTIKPAGLPSGNTRISAAVDSTGRTATTLKVPD